MGVPSRTERAGPLLITGAEIRGARNARPYEACLLLTTGYKGEQRAPDAASSMRSAAA